MSRCVISSRAGPESTKCAARFARRLGGLARTPVQHARTVAAAPHITLANIHLGKLMVYH